MNFEHLANIMMKVKGNPKVLIKEYVTLDLNHIGKLYVYAHRKNLKHIRKIRWDYILPFSVQFVFHSISHKELKKHRGQVVLLRVLVDDSKDWNT